MTKEQIQEKWFLSDLNARILKVAAELSGDSNYSKENAVEDLILISQIITGEV
jgi:hypothetical protein